MDLIAPISVFLLLCFSTSLFTHQSFLLIALSLFLYMTSFLTMICAVQPFFKTGMQMFVAGALLMVLFSLAYYPLRLLCIDKWDWSNSAVRAFFLFPPVGISHIFWELQESESIGTELSFGTDNDLVNR